MARPRSAKFHGSISRTTAYRLALEYAEYRAGCDRYYKHLEANERNVGYRWRDELASDLAARCANCKATVIWQAANLLSAQRLAQIELIDESVLLAWVSLANEG